MGVLLLRRVGILLVRGFFRVCCSSILLVRRELADQLTAMLASELADLPALRQMAPLKGSTKLISER